MASRQHMKNSDHSESHFYPQKQKSLTCIDPRYKDHLFPSADDKQQVKAWLPEELLLVHKKSQSEESELEVDNNNQESEMPQHSLLKN